MSTGPSLYFGLLLPSSIILLIMISLNIYVIIQLFRSGVEATLRSQDHIHLINKRLQNETITSISTGISWISCYVAFLHPVFPFQVLFCIICVIQGMVLFWIVCLRHDDVTKGIKHCMVRLRSHCTSSTTSGRYHVTTAANDTFSPTNVISVSYSADFTDSDMQNIILNI